jgi:hypothetical protein
MIAMIGVLGVGVAHARTAPEPLLHLAGGSPGCFEWIRSSAVPETEAARLPDRCRKLRQDYQVALGRVIAGGRKSLVTELSKTLKQARANRSPYEAILFSLLLGERSLLPQLREREKWEKKRKLKYQYAAWALRRLETGNCPVPIPMEYRELCNSRDSVLAHAGVGP